MGGPVRQSLLISSRNNRRMIHDTKLNLFAVDADVFTEGRFLTDQTNRDEFSDVS